MYTSPVSRRTFLQAAAATTLSAGLTHAADEKPRIGLIGCGGMGMGDAKNASRFGKIVAVCDVDADRLLKAAKTYTGAKAFPDHRKFFELADVDVVINATPDHWHTLINLAALKAGKDVYSEKPLTLTIDEGKRLVKAVKESGRVLQTGSQQRSDKRFRLAVQAVRAGRLGLLNQVTTFLPAGPVDGPFKPQPVPSGLDWDAWQGPTPETEYMKERCHLWFRYWLEYSGGTMTDWGAHHNDIALWAIGHKGPATIEAKVLKKPIAGGYTAPGEYEVVFTYYASPIRHVCKSTTVNNIYGTQVRDPKPGERGHGILFEGTDGWLYVTRGKIEASKPAILKDPVTEKKAAVLVSDDHMGNFFECVKTRKPPICNAEVGHRAASLCHLGGIALRLGRRLTWEATQEHFFDDKEANGYLAREQRKPWTYDAV